jgi:phosphoenolpyruvate-protein kinase (PTS system EI component)
MTPLKTMLKPHLTPFQQNFITMFEAMTDNEYMQERAADVRDVTKRIMAHLLGGIA